jgi:hypothetical protein
MARLTLRDKCCAKHMDDPLVISRQPVEEVGFQPDGCGRSLTTVMAT